MHTYIDFRYLVLGQKLDKLNRNTDDDFHFNDFALSEMIAGMKGNEKLFSTISIKRIIDYQWDTGAPMMKTLFKTYFIGFMIPFLIVAFTASKETGYLFCGIAFLT